MYLMIQNPGVAPIEAYTLLGASGSRNNDAVNGQFGTGNKLGITTLLREGYMVKVYCGKDRLVFGSRKADFEGEPIHRVTVSVNGKKAVDCGWTLDWGCMDWTKTAMGLRELVANALDASMKGRGYDADLASGDLAVKLVETKQVKAKAGFTRVFVSVGVGESAKEIRSYVDELPKRFLHFSDTDLGQKILPKAGRSISGSDRAMIYRMGIFVCEIDGISTYDYNLDAHEITIDECRNSNEYSVRASIARVLRKASAEELTPVLQAIGQRRKTMETRLDPDYLLPSWESATNEQTAQWQAAWKQSFNNAVMTTNNQANMEYVQRKGYRAQEIDSSAWRETLGRLGIKADSDVLSASEAKGYVPVGADMDHVREVERVWGVVQGQKLDAGKPQPKVACFNRLDNSDDISYYVEDGTIFILERIADTGGPDFQAVILQGIAEHVTGAGSLTTRFQDFITDLAVSMLGEFV